MSKFGAAFILIFLTGCVASVFRNPFYGILLYELEYFLHPSSRWWGRDLPDIRYAFTVVAVMFIGYMTRSSLFRETRFMAVPQFRWLLAMTIVVLTAYFWAADTQMHIHMTIEFLKFLFFCIINSSISFISYSFTCC